MQKNILGTATHYQFFAKKNAPTLILLHGWLQNWQSLSPIITALSEKYQLVIPDLPGFGESSFEQDPLSSTSVWNSDDYAQWLATFITSLDLPKSQQLFVAGHSVGGKVAAVCAATHAATTMPNITGIILISASGLPDPLSPTIKLKQTIISCIPEPLKKAIPTQIKSKLLSRLTVATDHLQSSDVQRAILKRIVRENIQSTLNKITIPSLLIWGKLDTSTPLHQGYAFHIALRSSKLILCKKSGHFPFVDEPKTVIAAITEFIDSTKI